MGIVNVTPDSFSDGGEFLAADAAIAHGRELLAAGADILDIGGESTRPGAAEVGAAEEMARVLPVDRGARRRRRDGLDRHLEGRRRRRGARCRRGDRQRRHGARRSRRWPRVCAERGCGLILMHMKGTPRTMQDDPVYDDVVAEVREFLGRAPASRDRTPGSPRSGSGSIPGIGFGKTVEHNLELIARLGEIARPRQADRGRRLAQELHRQDHRPRGRRPPRRQHRVERPRRSRNGADVLRVHDVAETIAGRARRRADPRRRRERRDVRPGAAREPAASRSGSSWSACEAFGAHGVSDAEREVGQADRPRHLLHGSRLQRGRRRRARGDGRLRRGRDARRRASSPGPAAGRSSTSAGSSPTRSRTAFPRFATSRSGPRRPSRRSRRRSARSR